MVDASSAEHRRLSLRFAVSVDLEYVEVRSVAEIDERQPHPRTFGLLVYDLRVEDLAVELVQQSRVGRQDRNMLETGEKSHVPIMPKTMHQARRRLLAQTALAEQASDMCRS